MFGQIILELNIELNDAGHGDEDANGLKRLNPDVSKGRTKRLLAVAIEYFAEARDEGEENTDGAVLEDA